MNVYGALYKDPGTSDEIAYFALERNTNTGSGDVAFWFLQDNADCVSNGTTTDWTGNHKDGDILVVSAFTNGGVVSTIDAYRWDGGAGWHNRSACRSNDANRPRRRLSQSGDPPR